VKKPDIELANFEAVYNFSENFRPNPLIAWLGHKGMNAYAPADLGFEGSAEAEIDELFESGTRMLLSMTHSSESDQYSVISGVEESETLRRLRGHAHIPAKESVFHMGSIDKPVIGRIVNPLLNRTVRFGVYHMGAIPTFRRKDVFGEGNVIVDQDRELLNLQTAASQRLLDLRVKLIRNGNHEGSFDEGTRNQVNWRRVQPLKRGRVDLINSLGEDVPIAILPIGLYYPEKQVGESKIKRDYRHPAVHIGRPITERLVRVEMLETTLRPALQFNLDAAIEMIRTKWGDESLLPESDLVDILTRQAETRSKRKLS
jgi:hypothetical protein